MMHEPDEQPSLLPKSIQGRYKGHSMTQGFTYEYDCECCGKTFTSTAPEATAPVLCHQCFTGRT